MSSSHIAATGRLTVHRVKIRGVKVPLTFSLGTAVAVVNKVPLLLVDVETAEGITGRSYLFCYTSSGARAIAEHLREAVDLVSDLPLTPLELAQFLQKRFALLGVTGTVRMALSALDIALWDALGQQLSLPLTWLLAAPARPLHAYDSRGLGLMPPSQLADEAVRLSESGLKALKLRLGYPTRSEDLAAVEAVRRAIGPGIGIMVDYNQSLSPAEAIHRGRALDDCGLLWIEEPIRHDDYESYKAISRDLKTPIQLGENFNGPEAVQKAVKVSASDYIMPDVARIGGVTGWLQAAGIAAASGIEMSSHLMPEISAPLLCSTPSAHWLEWVDWAEAILEEPLQLSNGMAIPSSSPGIGLRWDESRLGKLDTL
jgi:mandelate racemase